MALSKERTIFRLPEPVFRPSVDGRGKLPHDLDFRSIPTQYGTHALHAYVAAINPPLARTLVESYVPVGGRVLDPFCGGGGVLIEAILADRRVVGGDVNPLACIVSRAKTKHVAEERLRSALQHVRESASRHVAEIEAPDDEPLAFWFKASSLRPLAALARAVGELSDEDCRNVYRCVLSATARDVMLTYRGEVRLRKLVGDDLKRFRPDVFPAFGRRAALAIQRVSELPEGAAAEVEYFSARQLPFKDDAFTAIVCSPPYADDKNGVGYFQFSRYMLRWLGLTRVEIDAFRRAFLGLAKRDAPETEMPPSPTLHRLLEHVAQRSRLHHAEAQVFYSDYYDSIREMIRVAAERVVIVIGDRVLSRTGFNNGAITTELFEAAGAELEEYRVRTIGKKRIKDLGGDGGGTSREHVLVFKTS